MWWVFVSVSSSGSSAFMLIVHCMFTMLNFLFSLKKTVGWKFCVFQFCIVQLKWKSKMVVPLANPKWPLSLKILAWIQGKCIHEPCLTQGVQGVKGLLWSAKWDPGGLWSLLITSGQFWLWGIHTAMQPCVSLYTLFLPVPLPSSPFHSIYLNKATQNARKNLDEAQEDKPPVRHPSYILWKHSQSVGSGRIQTQGHSHYPRLTQVWSKSSSHLKSDVEISSYCIHEMEMSFGVWHNCEWLDAVD